MKIKLFILVIYLFSLKLYPFTALSGEPNLLIPENNSQSISLTPEFIWSEINDAISYNFQLSKSNNFEKIEIDFISPTNSYIISNPLQANTKYYWRVKAKFKDNESNWSQFFSFITMSVPLPLGANEVLLPKDKAKIKSDTVIFTWKTTMNATSYFFQLSLDNNFEEIYFQTELNDTNFAFIDTSDSKEITLYWRIKAKNSGFINNWTQPRIITITKNLTHFIEDNNITLNLLPNPAHSFIEFNFEEISKKMNFLKTEIEIYNSFGEIATTNIQFINNLGNFKKINISILPAGIYYLRVGNHFEKFIKY